MISKKAEKIAIAGIGPTVARVLLRRFEHVEHVDLSALLIVVPSRESGRLLREALARHAAEQGKGGLLPPTILTPAGLANWGLDRIRVADGLQAMLAWVEVLRGMRQEEVSALLPRPFLKDLAWCRQFAAALMELRSALGEGGLTIADVAARDDVPERGRWRVLALLEAAWVKLLERHGLSDREAARQKLAKDAVLGKCFEGIVMAATPDLTPLAVCRLEAEAAAGMPIDVLVAAEEAMLDEAFDRWGRPQEAYWTKRVLDSEGIEERLHVRRDPGRQANVVAELLGRSKLGAVCVGLIDPSLERLLESRLAEQGISVYNPEGESLVGHPGIVLLRNLIALLVEPSAVNASELLRCPDILMAVAERWRKRQEVEEGASAEVRSFDEANMLRAWDQLRQDHLPGTLAELHSALKRVRASSDVRDRRSKTGSEINAAVWFLEDAVRGFEQQPVNVALENFLKAVYGWRVFVRDAEETQLLLDPLAQVRAAVEMVLTFIQGGKNTLRAADVLSMALEHVASQRHYAASPDNPEVVPLQGWLELLWEDKPHLVLAGFNEGKVPESVTSHAFLPESLREILGLPTNVQRYARDAYLLWAIQAGRRPEDGGRVDIVSGQTSATGDPLRPSRLLLQCEDSVLPQRVAHLFAEDLDEQVQEPWRAAWQLAETSLPVPENWDERLSRGLSVTAIRDYLACPFRFYLTHVLRMQPADPSKMELDARDFGNVIHAAMEAFGKDPGMVASVDADAITAFLHHEVDRWMQERYGTALSVPMRQQQDAAKARLGKVARIQVLARQQGWRITDVELKIHETLGGFEIAGLPLRGVIDRIETRGEDNVDNQLWRVVDYKTTDSPVYNPEKETRNGHFRPVPRQGLPSHVREYAFFDHDADGRGSRQCYWVDLQLPLYCLAMQHARGVHPGWAHFRVSKKLEDIKIYEEPWEDELMAAAFRCAEGVLTDVRTGRFLPAAEKVAFENFERIILGRPLETVGVANDR